MIATKGAALDAQGRATLTEDLKSPCTEEIAVYQEFSQIIDDSRDRFVVVDTAPTGHTLLLLDATGSYHRESSRQTGTPAHGTTPLTRLQNPQETKVVLTALAETTPRLEAEGLEADLQRAGIHPWAWVVNNSLAAARPTSALLRGRAHAEIAELEAMTAPRERKVAVVPMLTAEPVGAAALTAMVNASTTAPYSVHA